MKTAITRLEWKFVKRITPFIGVMLIMQFQHVIYIDLSRFVLKTSHKVENNSNKKSDPE